MFYYLLVQRLYVVVGNDVGYGRIKLLFVTFSCEKKHGKILNAIFKQNICMYIGTLLYFPIMSNV